GQPRDDGRRKGAHRLAEIAQARNERFGGGLVELCHLLDVGAANQALLASARKYQDADRPVGCKLFQPLPDAVDHGGGEDVQRTRIGDCKPDDAARIALDAAILIEHGHGWGWPVLIRDAPTSVARLPLVKAGTLVGFITLRRGKTKEAAFFAPDML